ncbi:UV DNA damage repair endonuclease UvsE [candidate division WOR-3 bacterium]|nr:UV DNA damage repair endonuclease UvsE [candidate division WOR-3 bacterium]
MKIGYPCINNGMKCSSGSTFRIRNYSKEILLSKISSNLSCLEKTLSFNAENGLLFFRINSGLIPFGSHPVMDFDWKVHFKTRFKAIGDFIKKNQMRISMHPDQFTLINAKDPEIVKKSFKELQYHSDILDSMELDYTAKIQIHVGGVYGEKQKSLSRFVENYQKPPESVRKRLVVENDDRLYSLQDCQWINEKTGVPVLFDTFHHECLNMGEGLEKALENSAITWGIEDGTPMVDYSSQKKGARKGSHAESLDRAHFLKFLESSKGFDFDLMLEIKDKEKSALKALKLAKEKRRA